MTLNVVSRRNKVFIQMRPSVLKHLKLSAGDTNSNVPFSLPTGLLVVTVTEAAAVDPDLHLAAK